MGDPVQLFALEAGHSALVVSSDGCSVSIRSSVCSECGGSECGIPNSTVLVATLAVLIERDPLFREFLVQKSIEIIEGTYLPLAFREDVH